MFDETSPYHYLAGSTQYLLNICFNVMQKNIIKNVLKTFYNITYVQKNVQKHLESICLF